jgi:predicted Ser/Thr protein kinase
VRRLGEGGMGAVFLARDPAGREVAVKIIRPEFAAEDEFRARFRSEVNRARQVPPFCTAEVLDADPDHVTPYLVVEYVDGPSLAEVVTQRGPLAAGALHSVAVGVATALTAIHGAGVIHRDLKPRNVLFALGGPKVIDFGIARAMEPTSQHTRTDQMVGTVAYMAPERFDGRNRPTGAASDIFAWGAVVTYAATGRTPFTGDSPMATAARILTQEPDLTGLTGPLHDLVARALAKEPDDRPTARDLLDALVAVGTVDGSALTELSRLPGARGRPDRHATGGRSSGSPTLPDDAPGRSGRRTRRLVALAGAVVLTAASGSLAYAALPKGQSPGAGAPSAAAPAAAATTAAPVASSAAPRLVTGPTVVDALDRPGQWRPEGDDDGGCRFTGGRLVVTTGSAGTVECRGPQDSFSGDQSIAVDVTLLHKDSCALVYFRSVAEDAYSLSLCDGRALLELQHDTGYAVLGQRAVPALKPGARHRLGIEVRGAEAVVQVDAAEVLRVPVTEPALAAGRVVLGATGTSGPGAPSVAFARVEIRSR